MAGPISPLREHSPFLLDVYNKSVNKGDGFHFQRFMKLRKPGVQFKVIEGLV